MTLPCLKTGTKTKLLSTAYKAVPNPQPFMHRPQILAAQPPWSSSFSKSPPRSHSRIFAPALSSLWDVVLTPCYPHSLHILHLINPPHSCLGSSSTIAPSEKTSLIARPHWILLGTAFAFPWLFLYSIYTNLYLCVCVWLIDLCISLAHKTQEIRDQVNLKTTVYPEQWLAHSSSLLQSPPLSITFPTLS